MPYVVKSRGPAVLNRGPFETYREANAKRDELQQEPSYAGQEIYVEYVAYVEPERRHGPLDPRRRKYRSRGRSGSRAGGALHLVVVRALGQWGGRRDARGEWADGVNGKAATFEAEPAVGCPGHCGHAERFRFRCSLWPNGKQYGILELRPFEPSHIATSRPLRRPHLSRSTYSCSAALGSSPAARDAGSHAEIAAIKKNTTAIVTNVNGSVALIPTSIEAISRVTANAAKSPTTTPMAVNRNP